MRIRLSRRRLVASGVVAALALTGLGVGIGVADAARRAPRPGHHHGHRPGPATNPSTASQQPSTTMPMPSTSTSAPDTGTSTTSTTTPATTSSTPATTSAAPGSSLPPPAGVVFADHIAQFNVLCSSDHFAADDPIVFPGQPGRSHMHTFFGNKSTNAASTLASLSASSPSSCGRGMGTSDLSAYWVPSLMKKQADGTVAPVKTEQTTTVYYRRAGGGTGPGVLPFPKGLRMIAGNAMATSDQSLKIVQWDCGGGGLESPHMYACPGGSSAPIHASLVFPSCWDGVHLDSADHKSHMAYAAADGSCPADHPVSVPEVTFEIDYAGIAGGPDYSLASGGIYSLHGDFIADWDDRVQNALVTSCLNAPHECADMNRSGDTLFRPSYDPDPITIDLKKFSDTSPYAGRNLQGPVAAASPMASMSM